jgi:hypothetical protein
MKHTNKLNKLIPICVTALCLLLLLSQSAALAEDKPVERGAMKGWELYSWRNQSDTGTGTWSYSLLLGTNITKWCRQIKSQKATKTLEQLRQRLTQLVPGDEVIWIKKGAANLADKCELEMPPAEIVKVIEGDCKKAGAFLRIEATEN